MKENKKSIITRLASWVTIVVALLFVAQTGRSQVVFDNLLSISNAPDPTLTGGQGTIFTTNDVEFGDDIVLSPAQGTVLTNFSFQLYATGLSTAKGATIELKLYANDGANYGVAGDNAFNRPGTKLYDSTPVSLVGIKAKAATKTAAAVAGGTLKDTNTVHTITFDKASTALNVYVPSNFTWTVQFAGLNGASVGLVEYDPTSKPLVGTDYVGYWQASGGGWDYRTNSSGSQINFGAEAYAATVVAGLPPVVKVLTPKKKFNAYTEVISVTGTAQAKGDLNNAIQLVKVCVGTNSYKVVPVSWVKAKAPVAFSTTVDLVSAGPETVNVTAVDAANVSTTVQVPGTFVVTNQPLVINEIGNPDTTTLVGSWQKKINPAVTGTITGLQIQSSYLLTISEPKNSSCFLSNVTCNAQTVSGNITTSTNEPFAKLPLKYSFTMLTNEVLDVTYVTNRCFAETGTYVGTPNGVVGHTNLTTFTATVVPKKCAITGSFKNIKAKIAFKGNFGQFGAAAETVVISQAPYTITLTLPPDGSKILTGSINDGVNNYTISASR